MEKIKWCLKVKNGIESVEPNDNLAHAYIKKAEESLEAMRLTKGSRDWHVSTAYYTMYFSLYSILIKIGIKCEIHSCTLEVMKTLLPAYFNEEEYKFLNKSLQSRIDAQYYVNRTVADEQLENMTKRAPKFLVKCKDILFKLTESEIRDIRDKISNMH